MSFEPILLAPQKQAKEIYPYRRVWRSAVIEVMAIVAVAVVTVVVARFWTPRLSDSQRQVVGLVYALVPLGVWLAASYAAERRAMEPRFRLFTVAVLGAVVANGIGIPVVNRAFAAESWLSTVSGSQRIIGYMLTAGIVQEFLKYAVVRYSVWPGSFRIRSDGIAYALAAAVGYATALNINFVLDTNAMPQVYALRIAEITLAQYATSIIMGYFLAELRLNRHAAIWGLPGGLILASLVASLGIVLRGGLVAGGFGATSTGNNAFQGLGAAVVLVVFLYSSIYFLMNTADERARLRSRTESLE